MDVGADLDHLFRREAGKMTSALTRLFGWHRLALVEDVVHDALCRALEQWKFGNIPENPSAWLMSAAKNRAIDLLRRERTARDAAPDLTHALSTEWTLVPTVEEIFRDDVVRDEMLRMMFACCHAGLPEETHVALILNLLSGFGVHEIASAFFVSPAAMEKRLQRGKQVLSQSGALAEVTAERVEAHLPSVHGALYLLFNEGYHGSHAIETVRVELCAEAIRLTMLLVEHEATAVPTTHALLGLMCLVAARMPGRVDAAGDLVSLAEQDRTRWDSRLIERGLAALDASAAGDELTPFHVEAAIASIHTTAERHRDTDFARIVGLYDVLMKLRPSPVVALSRAIALGEVEGPERALQALESIDGRERLDAYPFYAAAMGEQLLRANQRERARERFRQALAAARSPSEIRFLEARITACT